MSNANQRDRKPFVYNPFLTPLNSYNIRKERCVCKKKWVYLAFNRKNLFSMLVNLMDTIHAR
jgi:hypothetical protein